MEIKKEQIEAIIVSYQDKMASREENAIIKELKALIEEPEWEPKVYEPNWMIVSEGSVRESTVSTSIHRLYGNESPTKEVAEKIAQMNRRNQRIMQAKVEMGYRDGPWLITKYLRGGGWDSKYNNDYLALPELGVETEEQAETIIKMVGLNED